MAQPSSLTVDSCKVTDPDQNEFVNSLIADTPLDIYYRGWVTLWYEDPEPKRRILVITNFSVITVKVNILGKTRRQKWSITQLSKLIVQEKDNNEPKLILYFGDNIPCTITSPELVTIFQHLLFCYESIAFGRPQADAAEIIFEGQNGQTLKNTFYQNYLSPEPDIEDGLLANYLAQCDLVDLPQQHRVSVLDSLMTAFQSNDRSLYLDEICNPLVDKNIDITKDLLALSSALKFSPYFQECIAKNCPLKDSGLTSLAPLFSRPTNKMTKLVLVGIKAGKVGFTSLSRVLAEGRHSLNFLNFSKNNIGDDGIKIIMAALDSGKKVMNTLCLRQCGFSSGKGYAPLVSLISNIDWLQGLKVLDVSDNRCGKSGTAAICSWLTDSRCQLEQLFLVRTEVDTEVLLPGIKNNTKLYCGHLRTLSLSGNKFTKKSFPVLCEIISTASSLAHFYLAECSFQKKEIASIIEAAYNNNSKMRFSLDFSTNDLGLRGAKEVKEVVDSCKKKNSDAVLKSGVINTLIFNENALGTEGIVVLCQAFTGTSLHTLSLDCNLKTGLFTSGKEAGDAIGPLINNSPLLKELSITGDDGTYFLKHNALAPVFTALADNKSLTHIDVSGNRLMDSGIEHLCEALLTNTSLTSLACDNNRMMIPSFAALHKALSTNNVITDLVVPMDDVGKLIKSLSGNETSKVEELRKYVQDLEMFMDRNVEKKDKANGSAFQDRINNAIQPPDLTKLMDAPYPSVRWRKSVIDEDGARPIGRPIPGVLGSPLQPVTSGSGFPHRKAASRAFDALVVQQIKYNGASTTSIVEEEEDESMNNNLNELSNSSKRLNAPGSAQPSVLPSHSPTPSPTPSQPTSSQSSPQLNTGRTLQDSDPSQLSLSNTKSIVPPVGAVKMPFAGFSIAPAKVNSPPPPPPASLANSSNNVNTSNNQSPAGPSPSVASQAPPVFLSPQSNSFPYEDLKVGKPLPSGVDSSIREQYLSDGDFEKLFAKSKGEFAKMPKWKQDQAKKTLQLF